MKKKKVKPVLAQGEEVKVKSYLDMIAPTTQTTKVRNEILRFVPVLSNRNPFSIKNS